jgi:flagellar biosynthesis/type III secretory pathway protein FliH
MTHSKKKYQSYHFPTIDGDGGGAPVRTEARRHRLTAEQRLAAVESQAYEEGYSQGREQGVALESGKTEPFLEIMGQATSLLDEHRRIIQRASRRDVVDIAMSMAQSIVRHEIHSNPAATEAILVNALSIVAGQEHVKVRVHPREEAIINAIIEKQSGEARLPGQIEIVADRHLQRGGCLIETDFGVVDARIDQQLAGICSDLKAVELEQPVKPGEDDDAADGHADLFTQFFQTVQTATPVKTCGNVTQVVGLVVEANGPVT